jgi:endo-1,4-beta-xylanase
MRILRHHRMHVTVGGGVMAENAGGSLRSLAAKRGIWIGAAVGLEYLRHDRTYEGVLAREFNMVTAENAMKFEPLRPSRQQYAFSDADTLTVFARQHHMEMRGHTLAWHRQLPRWLTEGSYTSAEARAVLRDHIHTVVGHFRGQVRAWDVVNEGLPVAEDPGREQSFWRRTIGPDYVELAFRWAHEADPAALLFYNDDDADGLGSKSDAIYEFLTDLIGRGVPIHGIGLQMHIGLGWGLQPQSVEANMRRFSTLGLEVHLTEMDVQVHDGNGTFKARLVAQAQLYRDMLHAALSVPSFRALVLWGVTDRYSWIPQFTGHLDAPLLFDAAYRPKPAYYALMHELAMHEESLSKLPP